MKTGIRWTVPIAAILGSAVLAGIETAQAHVLARITDTAPPSVPLEFASSLVTWLALAALIPVIVAIARRFPMQRPREWRFLLAHGIGCLTFPLLHIGLAMVGWYWLYMRFEPALDIAERFGRITATHYVMELFLYWVVVGAYNAVHFRSRYADREIETSALRTRTAELESAVNQAKLNALRWQLNPHFLFNTLNSIMVLIEQQQEREALEMTRRLAGLLRKSLDLKEPMVTLAEELDFIRAYIGIEEVRFSSRLTVRFVIDNRAMDAKVPLLLLQPLVENSFKHGVSKTPDAVKVEIGAQHEGDQLRLWVHDDSPRLNGSASESGLGLTNTRARLQQVYGQAARLRINDPAHENVPLRRGFLVEILIPVGSHAAR